MGIVSDERYTANPAKGNGHNRGAAIDLTLINAQTHKELEMPTGYDNFSDTAHHNFNLLRAAVKKNRALLRSIMEYFGFARFETEWWHYSLPDASNYPVFDVSFTDMKNTVD